MGTRLLWIVVLVIQVGGWVQARPGRWVYRTTARENVVHREGKPERVGWRVAKAAQRSPSHARSQDGTQVALFLFNPHEFLVYSDAGARRYQGAFMDSEGPMQMEFSPGNRYLALRVARTFGAFDVDLGRLYVLDLRNGQSRLWEESCSRIAWQSNSRLRYWNSDKVVHTVDVNQSAKPRR